MPRDKEGFHFIGANIPSDDARKLRIIARTEKRSVANLVEVILHNWLALNYEEPKGIRLPKVAYKQFIPLATEKPKKEE